MPRPPPTSTLFPYTTLFRSHLAAIPTAIYGFVLLMAAIAYYILQRTIIAKEGRESLLAQAVGRDWKGDRKSTRLNSSHVKISYAVFCLKKKKKTQTTYIAQL